MPERQTFALWKQNQEQKQMCCIFMYLKVRVEVTKPMSDQVQDQLKLK